VSPAADATVFAPATPIGRSALTVIRISGPAALLALETLTGRSSPAPRRAVLRALRNPTSGALLDRALVLAFPGPASETGEDMVELHLHGGRVVAALVLEALAAQPGLRPAGPGEFTRRAFMNGKLDLTACEGLADLVEAETRTQAAQALRQLDGELGRLYDGWREELLGALARIEAEIDFAAEEEVPDGLIESLRPGLARLERAIAGHLADGGRGERLRAGLTVAVLGPPNAGKSSLVNRLARREVAIVTERPGTTRDVIEVPLDLGGLPVTLLDTAGLREADATLDPVELEGIRRARSRAARADLRLLLFDGAAWPALDPATLALQDGDALPVVSKADLGLLPVRPEIGGRPALAASALSGAGLDALLQALAAWAGERAAPAESPVLTRARHRAGLEETQAALLRLLGAPPATELALLAEDLRQAARGLGRITGRIGVEEVLDRIFATFCIGK
jgi:tRNA modification GTPase